jgi:hypothetical protein
MTAICWYLGVGAAAMAAALKYIGLDALGDAVLAVAAALCGTALSGTLWGDRR